MTNPNPTTMDIIMEHGLSGEEAFDLLHVAIGRREPPADTGLTPSEWELINSSANETYQDDLDTIIQARRAKEEKAEGPDLEAAMITAKYWASNQLLPPVHNLARSYLQVLKELEDLRELHRPRHTADGEWPEEDYLLWDDGWVPMDYDEGVPGTWLPAPPKPSEKTP